MPTTPGVDELPLFTADAESGFTPQRRGAVSLPAKKLAGTVAVFTAFFVLLLAAPLRSSQKTSASVAPNAVAVDGLVGLASNETKDDDEKVEKKAPVVTSSPFEEPWPCNAGEELFFGTCYASCSTATNGKFPARDHECTCCKVHPCNYTSVDNYETDCGKFDKDAKGKASHPPFLTECPYKNEELWEGLCYYKCSELTYGKFPFRTGMNTCSNGKYGGNWTMGLGPCSGFGIGGTNCLPHIPKPEGAGVAPAVPPTERNRGQAPMGFTMIPVPVELRNTVESSPALKNALGNASAIVTKPR